ncbi:MAG: hypothetical protein L0Y77_01290 [Chlorobi bacterium]|nr:hypothetical protein [Chlorobiota bacterium]
MLNIILLVFAQFCSCGNIHKTPNGCVVAFIVAAEQRDMTKAWNILGPDAQSSYNSLGEKMRKSGRGALENEISRISKFRIVKRDYKIVVDSTDPNLVKIVTIGGPEHRIETINENGNYKIKDIYSVRNLLNGISAEVKNEHY